MFNKVLLVNDFQTEGGAEGVCREIEDIVKYSGGTVSFFFGSEKYTLPNSVKEYIHSGKFYNKIRKKIIDFRPDIIHLHNYYHLLSPSILRAIKDCRKSGDFKGRVIMTAHDYHLLCPDSGYYYYTGDKIVPHEELPDFWDIITKRYDVRSRGYSILKKTQWIFNYLILGLQDQIDLILSPSNFLKQKYAEKFPDKKIHVVRNPYEIELQTKKQTKKYVNNENLKLVFLGRVSPEKGIKEFISSLSDCGFENYLFDIIGDGPDMQNTYDYIKDLNLGEKIKLLGRIPHEQVVEKISTYDTIVLPSLWVENAPLVLVEAVNAQIRMLTSEWGGMKELAKICGGSYLMNPLDSKSVKKALYDIFRDINNESETLNRDLEKIKRIFSRDKFIDEIKTHYSNKSK